MLGAGACCLVRWAAGPNPRSRYLGAGLPEMLTAPGSSTCIQHLATKPLAPSRRLVQRALRRRARCRPARARLGALGARGRRGAVLFPVEVADQLDQLARRVGDVALVAIDHQRSPRHRQLADRNADERPVGKLLADGDPRHDREADLFADEALDVFEAPQLSDDAAAGGVLLEEPQDAVGRRAAAVVNHERLFTDVSQLQILAASQGVAGRR